MAGIPALAVATAAFKASRAAFLASGVVAPEHHGRGIARALSVEAINYFVTKGLKHAMLYVDADNEKGLKLYESLGFN